MDTTDLRLNKDVHTKEILQVLSLQSVERMCLLAFVKILHLRFMKLKFLITRNWHRNIETLPIPTYPTSSSPGIAAERRLVIWQAMVSRGVGNWELVG